MICCDVVQQHVVAELYSVAKAARNHMEKLLALNLGPEIRGSGRGFWKAKAPMKRGAKPERVAYLPIGPTIQ